MKDKFYQQVRKNRDAIIGIGVVAGGGVVVYSLACRHFGYHMMRPTRIDPDTGVFYLRGVLGQTYASQPKSV